MNIIRWSTFLGHSVVNNTCRPNTYEGCSLFNLLVLKQRGYNISKRYVQSKINPKYIQGQYPENDIKSREYFYYIDHQGMLFLDDAKMKNFTSCFKEIKFLKFFYSQLKRNNTQRYPEFPFISLCGKERNFIRCDDVPIVFTHMMTKHDVDHLTYGYVGELLTYPFQPEKLCMQMATGRVYHPGPEKGGGIGLIRSKLSIQISSGFTFNQGEGSPPTHFTRKEKTYKLTQELEEVLKKLEMVRRYSLGFTDR